MTKRMGREVESVELVLSLSSQTLSQGLTPY